MAAEILPIPESDARRKARQIIDANPGGSLLGLVAMAYLEGRVDSLREVQAELRQVHARHEYDAFCSRCGKRDGVRLSKVPPPDGFFQVVCFNCSAGDEPRTAA